MADFVICLYNPSSRKRADYLKKACEYILEYQSPDTVCGYVRNIGREGEDAHILTLSELKDTESICLQPFISATARREMWMGKW